MPARQRRRADLALLAIAVLLVGVATAIGVVVGDEERVTDLWVGAEFSSDGSARVTEVVDYDFGRERRHGIFRDIRGLSSEAAVTVVSATAPDDVTLIDMGSRTRIRVGDPSRTIGGRHRYRIQYRLDSVASGGRLAWHTVGTGWSVAVAGVEIHATAPFSLTDVRCVHPDASPLPCDVAQPEPGHLVGSINGLEPGEGATVYADTGRYLGDAGRLPSPPAGAIAQIDASPLSAGLLAAAVALIGAATTSRLLRRREREPVPAGGPASWPSTEAASATSVEMASVDVGDLGTMATIHPAPPEDVTPPAGGVMLAEGVRDDHKVAWLISAADNGYVAIENSGPSLVLTRPPAASPASVDTLTVALLDQAFAGRDRLALGDYDSSFAAAWKAVGDHLADWQRTSGLWDPAGDRRHRRARLLGMIVAPLGLILAALGGVAANQSDALWQAIVVTGAVIAGAGLAAVIRAWELRIHTPTGRDLWLRVESFRRFLATSEAQDADDAASRGQLGQFTAWAIALGEVDHWSRTVAASTAAADSHVRICDPAAIRDLISATWLAGTVPAGGAPDWNAPVSQDGHSGTHDWGGGSSGGSSGGGGGGSSGGGGSW